MNTSDIELNRDMPEFDPTPEVGPPVRSKRPIAQSRAGRAVATSGDAAPALVLYRTPSGKDIKVTSHFDTLEWFPNPHPGTRYSVRHICPEFTSVCPITGQPDFAKLHIQFSPNKRCVELKSLKLYLGEFRNEGHFYEDVTNLILNDLIALMEPHHIDIVAEFNVRGGISSVINVYWSEPEVQQ